MDLVAFLNARLDEDEATAHEVQAVLDAGWNYFDEIPTKLIDPARVLREVEAKRRIIERYEECVRIANEDRFNHPESGLAEAAYELRAFTFPALASVYSDHPGYDPAWA